MNRLSSGYRRYIPTQMQYHPTLTAHDPNPPITIQSPAGGGSFPPQIAGLRAFYAGAVKELCLVAEADAPAGMGGVLKLRKGGVNCAVYLVETTDPNASSIRIRTTTGIKAIRLKT